MKLLYVQTVVYYLPQPFASPPSSWLNQMKNEECFGAFGVSERPSEWVGGYLVDCNLPYVCNIIFGLGHGGGGGGLLTWVGS